MTAVNRDQPTIRKFGDDTTLRLSVRRGDYLLWLATDAILDSAAQSAWTIRDFWQLRDGDFVTITNRWVDLPTWFELHPLEVAGRAVGEVAKKLEQGFKSAEPMDGPNIWRVKGGDRLVWVTETGSSGDVRELFDFKSCALALGENGNPGVATASFFGAPDEGGQSSTAVSAARKGFELAAGLGVPRTFSPDWLFGA